MLLRLSLHNVTLFVNHLCFIYLIHGVKSFSDVTSCDMLCYYTMPHVYMYNSEFVNL